ncbi:hypothetical protein LEP3755_24580 [Leptolyngbya sp. NIES-3755]|nr:hypothetical protein LEP3755_24580 [Leptolyngbya sp. NIES-3755]
MNYKLVVAIAIALPVTLSSLLTKSVSAEPRPTANLSSIVAQRNDNDLRRQPNDRRDNIRQEDLRREQIRREEAQRNQDRRREVTRRVWIPGHYEPGFLGIGRKWVEGHWEQR